MFAVFSPYLSFIRLLLTILTPPPPPPEYMF